MILESERLLFRQHVITDMDAYCAMEMDAGVRRYVGGYPRSRLDAEKRFMGTVNPISGRLGMWATILKEEEKYIGRCGIYPHFNDDGIPIPDEAALGLYLAVAYWGRGLATEAARAFIKLGFNELKLKRIVTMIEAGNEASVKVIEKNGFKLISTEVGTRSFYHYALENTDNDQIL